MSERQFHKDLRMFLMQLSIYSYEGRDPFAKGLCADALASIPQWIPVEERLPDFDEDAEETNVLGYYPDFPSAILLVWYTGHHWEEGDGSGVMVKSPSHWMPLPEPPEVT